MKKARMVAVFLVGLVIGLALAYFANRFEIVYLGLDGVGYYDFQVKASFFREFPW